tara:strand:+ start:433 stop:696 length:264 start_codon:yes stop_codon:yes gene_type:complete
MSNCGMCDKINCDAPTEDCLCDICSSIWAVDENGIKIFYEDYVYCWEQATGMKKENLCEKHLKRFYIYIRWRVEPFPYSDDEYKYDD